MNNANVFWLLIPILLIFAVIAVRARIKLKQARSWPMGEGTVESTGIHYESRGGEPGAGRHVAAVAYSYSVNGQFYSGAMKREFMILSKAEKWLAGFPTGDHLIVRYNPAKAEASIVFQDEQAGVQLSQTA